MPREACPPSQLNGGALAIRAVAAGESYGRAKSLRPESAAGDLPHANLSAREHQIFMRVCQGSTVTDVAAELNLSVSTISTHLTNIKTKLRVRSIGEVINYAHRVGVAE